MNPRELREMVFACAITAALGALALWQVMRAIDYVFQ